MIVYEFKIKYVLFEIFNVIILILLSEVLANLLTDWYYR